MILKEIITRIFRRRTTPAEVIEAADAYQRKLYERYVKRISRL